EPVTVIEEVHLNRSAPDEPSAWAKIVLPAKAHAWVHTSYVDANKTVIPKTLNLRGGPGENYSVLGTLQKGDAVKEIRTKDKCMEIESPANAYAFMAAQYLSQEPSAMAATHPEAVTGTPDVAMTTTDLPPANLVMTNEVTSEATNEMATTETPVVEEPLPPRI